MISNQKKKKIQMKKNKIKIEKKDQKKGNKLFLIFQRRVFLRQSNSHQVVVINLYRLPLIDSNLLVQYLKININILVNTKRKKKKGHQMRFELQHT